MSTESRGCFSFLSEDLTKNKYDEQRRVGATKHCISPSNGNLSVLIRLEPEGASALESGNGDPRMFSFSRIFSFSTELFVRLSGYHLGHCYLHGPEEFSCGCECGSGIFGP